MPAEFSRFELIGIGNTDDFGSEWRKIPLNFSIQDELLSLTIAFRNNHARLSDIVPLAQQVCEKTSSVVLGQIEESGYGVPCANGCSACCSYLVPLSVPEAFRLKDQINQRPLDQQRMILRSCVMASRNLLGKMPPKLLSKRISDKSIDTKMIANWYANLKQVCPFLYKSQCTIYNIRPIACREYFIKGSSRVCKLGKGKAEVIRIPVSMVEVLGRLAGRLENIAIEAVMLPLVPAWSQENLERSNRLWPAEIMAESFVEIIEQMALDVQASSCCNAAAG